MELIIQETKGGCCSNSSQRDENGLESKTTNRLSESSEGIKQQVRERYADSALAKSSCGCSSENPFNLDSYENLEGYLQDADLGLGCGIPTEGADIREGHHVLDLGSGAGIDAFVARRMTGPSGSVTGVDFTPEMVNLAQLNASKLSYDNVSFVEGDIENLPLEYASFDRVISNCVLNLVPDKSRAFAEMNRVMRSGGKFTVSDIVLEGELPESILKTAEAYAGCVSGAIPHLEYLEKLTQAGFKNVRTISGRELSFSDEDLRQLASSEEIAAFRASDARVISITVTGEK